MSLKLKKWTPKNIKILREHLGLSQVALGRWLRVSTSTISAWEQPNTGKSPLGPARLVLDLLDMFSGLIATEELENGTEQPPGT